MSDMRNQPLQSLPVVDYCPAIARAVEWLGDRYLLAKPINATSTQTQRAGVLVSSRMCEELQGGRC
jgi:hypothetical protein